MKKHLTLQRRYFDFGTFGTLHREDGSTVCVIVEKPWKNNRQNESCVPEGTYSLEPHESPKFGACYVLENHELGITKAAPGLRTHILIHKANTPRDLAGCLAPGTEFGVIGTEWAVLNSRHAFDALMAELNGDPATLTITRG